MASKAAVLLVIATVAAVCAVSSAQTKFGKLVVTGVVPCNTGTLIDVATSPAFPDADVELRCGGNVVAGAKTSSNGSFAIESDMTNALAALLGACELVVDTPLVKCDGKLPAAGALVSYLQGPLARLLSGVFQLAPPASLSILDELIDGHLLSNACA